MDFWVCQCFFRWAELNWFAQVHVKMFSFFPVRDIPLRFISSTLFLSALIGWIYPVFVWRLRRFYDLWYSKISAAEIPKFLWNSKIFQIFCSAKSLILTAVFTGSSEMIIFCNSFRFYTLQLTGMEWYFYQFFSVSCREKKGNFLNLFWTDSIFLIVHSVS